MISGFIPYTTFLLSTAIASIMFNAGTVLLYQGFEAAANEL